MIQKVLIFLLVFVGLMLTGEANSAPGATLSSSDARMACVNRLVTEAGSQTNDRERRRELIRLFNDAESGYLQSQIYKFNECSFDVVEQINSLKSGIADDKFAISAINPTDETSSNLFKEDATIRAELRNAAEDILNRLSVVDGSYGDENLISDILRTLDFIERNGLADSYAQYGARHSIATYDVAMGDSDSDSDILAESGSHLQYAFDGKLAPRTCTSDGPSSACESYIETLLFARVFADYWGFTALQKIKKASQKLNAVENEYRNYFFESGGDGLYPWEVWVNSLNKSDAFFSVPNQKFNVFHPSPYVAYDNASGDLSPSAMVETIGVTFLNYSGSSDVPSAPIGAALAIDYNSDRFRYGAVVHLPLKRAVYALGTPGKTLSEYVPCEACSFVFLTDGDDDWTVGVKLNAASLLFSPDKAQNLWDRLR